MKYVRTFESFRNNKNSKVEPVNEEIFGAIGRFFSNMFKKAKEMINKTKGGAEIEQIYYNYLKLIDEQFAKQANVKLNLLSIAKGASKKNESMIFEAEEAVESETETAEDGTEEAGGADAKMTPDTLKQKNDLLVQIINKMKTTALSEMDGVLKKYGGAAKNPQLAVIIQTRKDQFDLDFMNAKISFLEKAGDKTMVSEITKQRDAVAKKIENSLKKVENVKPVEYKEGDQAYFLKKDKTKEEWDKLTDDEKKKPEEGKAAELVELLTISKVDGDKFSVKDSEGKEVEKTSDSLIKKKENTESDKEGVEYKEGDTVIFKRGDYKDNDGDKRWSELKDEDKKNPESDGIKKMIEDGLISIKKVEKVDGDLFTFKDKEGNDKKKNKSEILVVANGAQTKAEGQGEGQTKSEGQGEEKTEGEEK